MLEKLFVQQLKQASPRAVREWYELFHHKVYRFILKKVSTTADAEELTQDVFLSCLKALPLFRGESSIWTWMMHVAQHEVADYYRKRYAKKCILALPLPDFLPTQPVQRAEEISQKVLTVLEVMSQEHREILLMKYLDRKKVAQIATETGKSVKSVESTLFRARDEFKVLYGAEAA